MKNALIGFLGLFLLVMPFQAFHETRHHSATSSVVVPPRLSDIDTGYQPEAFRRGGYRSPRMGYAPGNRTRNPAVNNPPARTPAAPARPGGFMGGLFGGLLAGTLLGSLFNPFGFGVPGGFSLIGLLFWGVILFLVYRLIKRAAAKRER